MQFANRLAVSTGEKDADSVWRTRLSDKSDWFETGSRNRIYLFFILFLYLWGRDTADMKAAWHHSCTETIKHNNLGDGRNDSEIRQYDG
jgi:hypothetical protein